MPKHPRVCPPARHPSLSIVIPLYNEEENVEPLVKAIFRVLAEDPDFLELVLVDDGSRDRTARLWLLQIEDLLALARHTLGRNLSKDEWRTFLPDQPYFEVFPGLPIPKK